MGTLFSGAILEKLVPMSSPFTMRCLFFTMAFSLSLWQWRMSYNQLINPLWGQLVISERKPTDATKGKSSSDVIITLKDTKKEEQKKELLVVAAGRGTTATHLMFEATCYLGFPSHHWQLGCIPMNASPPANRNIPKDYQSAAQKHDRLRRLIHQMHSCVHEALVVDATTNTTPSLARCGNAAAWRDRVLSTLEEVVTDGRIVALHDNPYPYLLFQLLTAAQRNGKETVLLLSERDPNAYVARRSNLSYSSSDPLCKDETFRMDPSTLMGGGFDLIGCIDRAVTAASFSDNKKVDLVDVFTTFARLVESDPNGTQIIARHMEEYQEAVRQRADFFVNVFAETNQTTTVDEVANVMAQHVELLSRHRQPKAQFVNWWKKTKVDR